MKDINAQDHMVTLYATTQVAKNAITLLDELSYNLRRCERLIAERKRIAQQYKTK